MSVREENVNGVRDHPCDSRRPTLPHYYTTCGSQRLSHAFAAQASTYQRAASNGLKCLSGRHRWSSTRRRPNRTASPTTRGRPWTSTAAFSRRNRVSPHKSGRRRCTARLRFAAKVQLIVVSRRAPAPCRAGALCARVSPAAPDIAAL